MGYQSLAVIDPSNRCMDQFKDCIMIHLHHRNDSFALFISDDKAQSLKQKKSEAELLRQEADMPIEELMAKYEYGETPQQPRARLLRKKGHATNSPVIKPKKMSFPSDAGEEATDSNKNANLDVNLEEKISNGHAENENNLNLEKESQMSSVTPSLSSSVQQDTVSSSVDGSFSSLPSSSKEKSLTADTSNNQADSSVSSNTLLGSSQATSLKGASSSSHAGGSGSSKSESDQVGSTESGEVLSILNILIQKCSMNELSERLDLVVVLMETSTIKFK